MAVLMTYCAIADDLRGQPAILPHCWPGMRFGWRIMRNPARALLRTDRRHLQSLFWCVRVPSTLESSAISSCSARQFSFRDSAGISGWSSLISVFSAGLAAWLGGFRWTARCVQTSRSPQTHAEAPASCWRAWPMTQGIINAAFYTTLVITAVGHLTDGRSVVALRAIEGLATALHQSRRNVEARRT